jgi:hypothetical protein
MSFDGAAAAAAAAAACLHTHARVEPTVSA